MSDPRLCPVCQSALAPSAPQGLCPKCLWASLVGPDLDDPEDEVGALAAGLTEANEDGTSIFGDYALLNEIARGGMGIVYRARQISLQRVVALKMILASRLPGESDMQRFRAEAEAVAGLDHPNIVPIYEVGEHEGDPYFTMKFVAGGSLAQRTFDFGFAVCDLKDTEGRPTKSEITNRQAQIATLMAKVARAVHHAHQRGILHRDLKPSNILLDERDEPLVTDFGLAKQIEAESDLTLSGAVLGTPAYIAPEQAAGGKSLTVAVDVYSLGAVLYELLTGRPPFQAGTPLETLRQVIDREIRRPSSINRAIERDLDTVCLKCLQKDPAQRYSSAEAVAEDLERWLRHEPIHARRAGAWERSAKWARRHPTRAALIVLALIAPCVIIAVLLAGNAKVRGANLETRLNLYAADVFLADRALREGNLGLARTTLANYLPAGKSVVADDFRSFEWRLLWGESAGDQLRVFSGFPRAPTAIAISPDGRTLAIGGQNFLWRWNLDDEAGTELLPPKEPRWLNPDEAMKVLSKVRSAKLFSDHNGNANPTPGEISAMINPLWTGDVTKLSFSADGRQIVSSTRGEGRAVRIWSMADGAIEYAFPSVFSEAVLSPAAPIVAVGSFAATLSPGSVRLYDLEQRAEIWELREAGGQVAFSGDGRLFITGGWDRSADRHRIALWSLPERRMLKQFWSPHNWNVMTLSPDAKWIAAAIAGPPAVAVWSVERDQPPRELPCRNGAIRTLAFSPDSQLLAMAGADQVVRLWSVDSGELSATKIGHTDEIASLCFFPDGRRLASASRDGTVRVWATAASEKEALWMNEEVFSDRLLVSPDSRTWTTADVTRKNLRVWNTHAGSSSREISNLAREPVQNEGFDDGGQALVSSVYLAANQRIDLEWRSVETLDLLRRTSLDGRTEVGRLGVRAFSAAAGLYAQGQADGLIRVWSTRTGELMRTFVMPDLLEDQPHFATPVGRVALSPDGDLLAASLVSYSQIAMFSIRGNKLLYSHHARPLHVLRDRKDDPGHLRFLSFSSDGKRLASTDSTERVIRIREAHTGRELGRLAGHRDHTAEVGFSPDGKTLASTGGDGSLKLWHLPTWRETATLLESGAVGPVAFSPDGSMLFVALDRRVRVFRAPSLAESGNRQ